MITRRSLFVSACALGTIAATNGFLPRRASAQTQLTLFGPPAGPSIILAALATKPDLALPLSRPLTYQSYLNPDKLRAGFISGDWQAAIAPSYVAANLANKGLPVKLLNIMSQGLLHVISFDKNVKSPLDLAGETIGMFYRNDMPDLVFARTMQAHGLTVSKDYHLRYTGSPIEALQLLLSGRIQHCVLPEPAATAAIDKATKLGKHLFRAIDLAAEWSNVTGNKTGQPLAGIMLATSLLEAEPSIADQLHAACLKGTDWVLNHPDHAANIAAASMPLTAQVIAKSIPASRLKTQRAADMKEALESFFSLLARDNPAIIGGKLPAQDFYL